MSIAKIAVEKKTVTVFATFVLLVGGLFSYSQLGQLEDPEFTVKTAVVTTTYPGASAEEVELEVTDRIEQAIQEMPQLKQIESYSRAGVSNITVDIKPSYTSDKLPQIWDELRKKVGDVSSSLPPGAGVPIVADDFGDVYGFLLAITGDGFDYNELEDYCDDIKKELSLVSGVSRVELWGVQKRCIYLDVSQTQLTQLGIRPVDLQRTLSQQNLVVDSGGVEITTERLRIQQTGDFKSPEEIGELVVRGGKTPVGGQGDELIRIKNIATVRRGYVEPPRTMMRYDGQPALGISVSNVAGTNVVTLGENLQKRLAEIEASLPVGIEIHEISWQSDMVTESIDAFTINLIEAVIIVMCVLWIAMGFRVALIVGICGLVFTIVISFLFMYLWKIDLQRMSLGALIVAMGMMVDNAIVVVDGIMVRVNRGMDRAKAAVEAASEPAWPLLGATLIAVMAFYPIYASEESAGEYCVSLFQVVAIALLLSWVLCVTITPLMCIWLLPKPDKSKSGYDADPYGGKMYAAFRDLLKRAIRFRWPVVAGLCALLVLSGFSFKYIDSTFFPDSARLQVMIDYWAPEGTRIQTVSEDMRAIENKLLDDPKVESVSTFLGQGPPRFYLPVDPEKPYQSYGQLIVNVKSFAELNELIPEINIWMAEHVPQALTIVRRYGLGPSESWKVEARISGPSIADETKLRELGEKGVAIFKAEPASLMSRTNWRQQTKKVVVDYNQHRARWSGVSRKDIGHATKRAYDGSVVGQYREKDKLYPILVRHTDDQRKEFAGAIGMLQVQPATSIETVPLAQVVSRTDVEWEDPIIWRFNRRRTITVEANPFDGMPASALRDSVLANFVELRKKFPPEYRLDWGGEYESSRDAQQSLIPGIVPALMIAALLVVGLFNAFRPPLIIALVIPFAMIGVAVGLLVTGQPLGFLALLGVMSLGGMMVKNGIVLLDQVNIEKASGKNDYQAVIDAAVSRLRPVLLAAATTVLGVIPLLQDVFWVAMAVTIMFGLAFGTVLTMVIVPVLYAILFRLRNEP